jgi:chromosome segregation ATPase
MASSTKDIVRELRRVVVTGHSQSPGETQGDFFIGRCEQPDPGARSLECDLEELTLALDHAERALERDRRLYNHLSMELARGEEVDVESIRMRMQKAAAKVSGLRQELDTKRNALGLVEERNASERVCRASQAAIETTKTELEAADARISVLPAEYAELPERTHAAQFRFSEGLEAYNHAKEKCEVPR